MVENSSKLYALFCLGYSKIIYKISFLCLWKALSNRQLEMMIYEDGAIEKLVKDRNTAKLYTYVSIYN